MKGVVSDMVRTVLAIATCAGGAWLAPATVDAQANLDDAVIRRAVYTEVGGTD